MDELEAAIQHLKLKKSPGLDIVYTELLKKAGSNYIASVSNVLEKVSSPWSMEKKQKSSS